MQRLWDDVGDDTERWESSPEAELTGSRVDLKLAH